MSWEGILMGGMLYNHKDLNFDPQNPSEGQAEHASVTIHGGLWKLASWSV